MKRLLALAFLALTATGALAAETQRYLISTKNAPRKGGLRLTTNAVDIASHRVRTFRNINAFAADLTLEEVAELQKSGEVEIIEPVVERHIFGFDDPAPITANATSYTREQVVPWGVPVIGAPDVWAVTKGSPNVNVAVVDTGIDYEHPDLAPAFAGGYNTFDPLALPLDDHHHGTHVAGTIAAADNGFGVVGIAPSVKLWAVKVLDERGRGTAETLTAGLDWVISKAEEVGGRWVVNLSLGSKYGSRVENIAINRALAADIVIVAATGNTGAPYLNYPAAYTGVIGVGASDNKNALAAFSTFGPGMSVVAPGVAVISTYRNGSVTTADVLNQSALVDAVGIDGSPYGTVTGRMIDCGLGYPEDFPTSIRGKIAFIKRGVFPFREKARNAKEAGAAAVVIYNVPEMSVDVGNWTMVFKECTSSGCSIPPEWENYRFPLTVGTTVADGAKLKDWLNKTVTVGFRQEDYGPMSGTSMATPHVTGAVALLLSLAPDLNAAQVSLVIERTAADLHDEGWDLLTGWGMLDLAAAARYVAPAAFGLPPTDPIPPSKRRGAKH